MNLPGIQEALQEQGLDGWLFFDHHRRDPLAYKILNIDPDRHVTRRWYYLVRATGEPIALVHRIEAKILDGLPGEVFTYASWTEQVNGINKLLTGMRKIAMQYSPSCEIPYVSMVDAGTLELVRKTGVEVVTSAELVQTFEARLDMSGMDSHREAGRRVDRIRADAFELIQERLRNGLEIDEYFVNRYVRGRMTQEGLFTGSGPIVGVNRNAGDPHYEPTLERHSTIQPGDLVLLDMWAKLDQPDSVYYDITWTAYCGLKPPERMVRVFEIVRDARDRAVSVVQKAFEERRTIRGYEVDDAARAHIESFGYGANFVHRTGHSIGHDVHGSGANMDNLEVHDERKVIPWTCFSIEPGIYLDDFGIRSELNIFTTDESALVTGEIQSELVTLSLPA